MFDQYEQTAKFDIFFYKNLMVLKAHDMMFCD